MSELRPKFWETIPLEQLNRSEWEALCDGCGKCCLNKLEDADTGEVELTRVACRLLDDATCQCSQYETRHQIVPECIVLTPETIAKTMYWLPLTCAYRLRYTGKSLHDWHPLISGDPASVHRAGISMVGQTVSEFGMDEDDWENYIIEDPS
ncbi:MAG: YcgN family cysteine cluster protein [Rhodobacteraceae bacterium]|nr:YcgN family cysteine cluster protein [Paracoccaceae bacterium]